MTWFSLSFDHTLSSLGLDYDNHGMNLTKNFKGLETFDFYVVSDEVLNFCMWSGAKLSEEPYVPYNFVILIYDRRKVKAVICIVFGSKRLQILCYNFQLSSTICA